ncbi:hypothetical protein [Actinokineospora enzanensis]|nr:hypothetical protein [Actinokineospora enzanensis]
MGSWFVLPGSSGRRVTLVGESTGGVTGRVTLVDGSTAADFST